MGSTRTVAGVKRALREPVFASCPFHGRNESVRGRDDADQVNALQRHARRVAGHAGQDDPTDCYGSAGSVWYAFTPSESGTLDIPTAGSDYDTALGVYTGSRGALSPVACNDDADGR